MQRFLGFCLGTMALLPLAAQSAEIEYNPPSANQKTAFIKFKGILAKGEALKLGNTLEAAQKTGKQLAVVLDLSGGDEAEAILTGRLIRSFRADTYHDYCSAECIFAFVGGERRFLMKIDPAAALVMNRPQYADIYVKTMDPALKERVEKLRAHLKRMTGEDRLFNQMMDTPSTIPHTVDEKEALGTKLVTQVLRD